MRAKTVRRLKEIFKLFGSGFRWREFKKIFNRIPRNLRERYIEKYLKSKGA